MLAGTARLGLDQASKVINSTGYLPRALGPVQRHCSVSAGNRTSGEARDDDNELSPPSPLDLRA